MLEERVWKKNHIKRMTKAGSNEYGRKLRTFLSGVKDRGGILSSKVPQMDVRKRRRRGGRAKTKEIVDEGLEKVTV